MRPPCATPNIFGAAAKPVRPGGCIGCSGFNASHTRSFDVDAATDPLTAAARASAAALKRLIHHADAETFALLVADLALANRLGWARPVPLLAVAIRHPALRRVAGAREGRPRATDGDWPAAVAHAYALAVEMARRTQKLLAVAPMLRAKGTGRVIDRLLSDVARRVAMQVAAIFEKIHASGKFFS